MPEHPLSRATCAGLGIQIVDPDHPHSRGKTAAQAGLENAVDFSAHGLRAGGPTEAAKAGQPVSFIAEHSRWSETSPQVLEYIRSVDRWRDNPMRGIGL